jgi:hypothetical protein
MRDSVNHSDKEKKIWMQVMVKKSRIMKETTVM